MATTLSVSGLTDYVNVHRDELLVKATMDSKTMRYIDVLPNIKYKDAIPYLDSQVELSGGTDCSWDPAGSDVLSERYIETKAVKVNKEWCWKEFEKKFMNYQLRWEAGREPENMPFEEKFADSNMGAIQEAVEVMLWSGNTAAGVTGFIADIQAESGLTTAVTGLSSASTAIEIVDAVVAACQAKKAIKKGYNIFMSHTLFTAYIAAKNAACCFKAEIDAANEELVYPGDSRIKLVPVAGLDDINAVVASPADGLVYGTDVENSENVYKVWYSEDDDKFRFRVLFRAGTALRFPDEVVYYIPA